MDVKFPGLTGKGHSILRDLRAEEGGGIAGVVVKCVDIGRTPVAKAAPWSAPDTQTRKLG